MDFCAYQYVSVSEYRLLPSRGIYSEFCDAFDPSVVLLCGIRNRSGVWCVMAGRYLIVVLYVRRTRLGIIFQYSGCYGTHEKWPSGRPQAQTKMPAFCNTRAGAHALQWWQLVPVTCLLEANSKSSTCLRLWWAMPQVPRMTCAGGHDALPAVCLLVQYIAHFGRGGVSHFKTLCTLDSKPARLFHFFLTAYSC